MLVEVRKYLWNKNNLIFDWLLVIEEFILQSKYENYVYIVSN